jgi:hypothetical protein
MVAIIVGLLAGLGGLLATAVTAVLGPILGLHRSVAAVAARATTARVSFSARDRADGVPRSKGHPREHATSRNTAWPHEWQADRSKWFARISENPPAVMHAPVAGPRDRGTLRLGASAPTCAPRTSENPLKAKFAEHSFHALV